MMAGADFIKTSTGKENVNANLPVGLTMLRAIEEFYQETHRKVEHRRVITWMWYIRECPFYKNSFYSIMVRLKNTVLINIQVRIHVFFIV